jgi:hypothetical protein
MASLPEPFWREVRDAAVELAAVEAKWDACFNRKRE